jgi:hypothetical protein
LSSLSWHTLESPQVPPAGCVGTRSTTEVESVSVDGKNLDEEDNMYNQFPDTDDDSDSDDNDDDENDEQDVTQKSLLDELNDICWNFCVKTSVNKRSNPAPYNGPAGLKRRVATSFSNPLECVGFCGGLDYGFVARLTRNSNEFVRKYLSPSKQNVTLHGKAFKNITTEEKYHFLGITLRISLSPVDWGGYEAYFSETNKSVCIV